MKINLLTEKCKSERCINIMDARILPFEEGTRETQRLFSYFLHSAPNIESSLSSNIPREKHAEIFDLMMEGRHYKYMKFCSSNTPIDKELQKGHLSGVQICLKCKRMVCKKKKLQNKQSLPETDLECFLRHIRNSIAHGLVSYIHAGNRIHIVFEDTNGNNLSARIVCIKADLEQWKTILSDTRYYSS